MFESSWAYVTTMVLWAKQQLEKLAPNYPNLTHFCEYLNQHWLPKARMWCIGNQNIPHARQDINLIVESFHINMKRILYSFREAYRTQNGRAHLHSY
jgi:hypothetical protein